MTGPLFSRQFLNLKILSITILFVFCGFEARSDVILGGLQTLSSQASINFSGKTAIAQSFSYSSNFTLTGINLNLFNTSTSNTGNYTVSLYTGGLTGTITQLSSGTWESLRGTNSSNVVSISGLNSSLLMNTTYWIGVSTTALGGARNWSTFNNQFGNGTSYTDTATHDGTTWTTALGSSTNAMGMEIVAAVPEPSTLVLSSVAFALGALCVWWKRRRNKPAGTNLEVC
jgi:hypothetical protein